jgi:hypothetical protein
LCLIAMTLTAAACGAACAKAEATVSMERGRYRIEVRTELPNLGDAVPPSVHEICLATEPGRPPQLGVLGAGNPLAACPVSDIRLIGQRLAFRVAGPGLNAASGEAQFDLEANAFRGRIAMKMGGKNMTLTEWQSGRRIGPCLGSTPPDAAHPHPRH